MTEVRFSPSSALTVAGSDPSGGAGLQADLKIFQQLGVYGMSVVTLITVQNTLGVQHVEVLDPKLVFDQFEAVVTDIKPHAIKTGALGNVEVMEAVHRLLKDLSVPIVVDPVMVSKHGHLLMNEECVEAFRDLILPLATLITPNRFEAERLTGLQLDSADSSGFDASARLRSLGASNVLLKLGKHKTLVSHVFATSADMIKLDKPYIEATNTHGTGCVLSAAITARLASGEQDLRKCVDFGIQCVRQAISTNTQLGQGIHPAETRAIQKDLH